ncbi:EamA family transporter, partial [candidate division KSB1 bacterium]|nr:EamA family transporter [candidate division KSB1 bacterium]NIV70394.1 EamA family transporter [Phycisphaerae bacterium]NIU25623.1 EamA family transporter [candidate division KSB1 bacterium]NIU93230.1 EamA family transporter [candidate division KSB1 bacterium]NIW19474.1 EamA family transporter [candidate division KSB1 bacterium]
GLGGITLVFWPEILAFDWNRAGSKGLILAIAGTAISSMGNMASAWNQSKGLPVVQTNAISMGYGTGFLLLLILSRGAPINFDLSWSYVIS